MKTRKKAGAQPPLKVKAFISSVTSIPLENIEAPLSQFSWDFEKGDFHHWVDLFYHFDLFFEKYVKSRKDLKLDGDIAEDDPPFPKDAVLQILRVTASILENCSNKYLYGAHENITALLGSTDLEIVVASLRTLAVLVKKPIHSGRSVRWHGDSVVNERLFALSQGWGGREEGLGLLSCATENGCDLSACKLGSTLHFEFYASEEDFKSREKVPPATGLQVIHIEDVHTIPKSDLQLFKELCDEYKVPSKSTFPLFTRLRFARSFHLLPLRRQFIRIRLLALTILLQSNPQHGDLAAFFANEPEFVNELLEVLEAEESIPEDMRILTILVIAAQAQDRPRQTSVLNVLSAGGYRGVLPSLVHKAVISTTSESNYCSLSFMDALLSLVTVLVSTSTGCSALREAGLIPTLLPLLRDTDPQHIDLVSSALRILEAFMDYSNPAGTLFRDLGGLDDTIARLHCEVSCVEESFRKACDEEGGNIENGDSYKVQVEALIPYRRRLLLKALLRAIALGSYYNTRLEGAEESTLPSCLCAIFRHAKEFGGGVFSLAASVMSDLINKDPTSFPVLHAAGLTESFLASISKGILPSSDVVSSIPHALDALCLNRIGLQAVEESNPLQCYVKVFTSKAYLHALIDTSGSVASGFDELMRHAPSLRGPGIDACIAILNTLAVIGGAGDLAGMMKDTDAAVPMDTDGEENSPGSGSEEKIELLPEYIDNTVQLLEPLLQNADTCQVFIEKKGIDALLRLFTLPCLPVAFGGTSAAFNLYATFRAFSSAHASTLSRAVCSALKEQLGKTIEALESCGNTKFPDLEGELSRKVFHSLSAMECFLSFVSSLVKGMAPMMEELSSGVVGIFSDIGKVHRWVLWQGSLVDDNQWDVGKEDEKEKEDSRSTSDGSSEVHANGSSDGVRESEPDTLSVVRYGNPANSLGGHSSRWNVELDLLPLLQMGQGLDRRSQREHGATTELLAQFARLFAQHARATRIDPSGSLFDGAQTKEQIKHKSLHSMNVDTLTRLANAARGLYVALSKAMVVPSRRREDAVTVTPAAKPIASSLATLLLESLCLDKRSTEDDTTASLAKCRYLGKVAEDIVAVLNVDGSRKRTTCNTLMVNSLFSHGTVKQFLLSFEATMELLWTVPQGSKVCSMEVETKKLEGRGNAGTTHPWLFETVQSCTKLMEHLVNSSHLLSPPSMAQLLIQPIPGATIPVPRDPEVFVLALQSQVLDAVLPIWKHPLFPRCNPTIITAFCSIIMRVYSGVSDPKTRGPGAAAPEAHALPPPLDESTVSLIVEMGFSRARAEEALRRIRTNSVEMATEWLLSHPEESLDEDEDELACALAMSLGNNNSGGTHPGGGAVGKAETVKPPRPLPVEDMLSACMDLIGLADAPPEETVVFALADLLLTMCRGNEGRDREIIVSSLVQQLHRSEARELCSNGNILSAISHILAIILFEDSGSRKVAAEKGLVSISLDLLAFFQPGEAEGDKMHVPKWVAALLLILEQMLHYDTKFDTETTKEATPEVAAEETSNRSSFSLDRTGNVTGQASNPWEAILGKPTGYMTDAERQRAMALACSFIQMKLPAATIHAVLKLCAKLTKVHSVAMQFLEAGGLVHLLDLPRSCLFPGFDALAASVIRHLLEDPLTLQSAMESEIRHSLASTMSRHNGRISPRTFLTAMASVISRDPAVFLQASSAVCQIESVGGRSFVVLLKEREKDKEKEKDGVKNSDKDRIKVDESSMPLPAGSSVVKTGSESLMKPSKGYKKVSQSFYQVIEQLLDVIVHFTPSLIDDGALSRVSSPDPAIAMEVDDLAAAAAKDKGKGKVEEGSKVIRSKPSEKSAVLVKVTFILKLMSEIILMYSSAVTVVLRQDTESSQGRVPCHTDVGHGGLLYHVLHKLLPHTVDGSAEKTAEDEWTGMLSSKAGSFLLAICLRSAEGRKRIFLEIAKALNVVASSVLPVSQRKAQAFVKFLNNVLSSSTSSGTAQVPGLSNEMAKAALDAGLVHALSILLQGIDLDHPDAPKLVNGVLKVLEALTRAANSADQSHSAEANEREDANTVERPQDQVFGPTGGPLSDSSFSRQDRDVQSNGARADLQMAIRAMQGSAGSDSSRDGQMEGDHEMLLDRDTSHDADLEVEEEFIMHEAADDTRELADVAAAALGYRMGHLNGDDMEDDDDDDDDDDMEGGEDEDDDDGDEDDDEDDEDDDEDLEDEVAHLSPPDTDAEDQDDHDLEDDYYDDQVEGDEEEEDDIWHENQVIEVRWRDGLTGLDHVQVVGPTGTGDLLDLPLNSLDTSFDDLLGAFRRINGDRRRTSGYRPFLERLAGDRTRSSEHPLLTRTSSVAGASIAGNGAPALGGMQYRDTEDLLAGSSDVTHFYMHDGPFGSDHSGAGLFRERGVGRGIGQPSSFFELSVDPMHRMGRRAGRGDGRFANWADGGIPQGGSGLNAAAIAQALEDRFLSHLGRSSSRPLSDQPSVQTDAELLSTEHLEESRQGQGQVPIESRERVDVGNESAEMVPEMTVINEAALEVAAENALDSPLPAEFRSMDGRNGPPVVDVEAASQDSSESGATFGESLRSLEVEIGSADGHDEGGSERQRHNRDPPRGSGQVRVNNDEEMIAAAQERGGGDMLPISLSSVAEEERNGQEIDRVRPLRSNTGVASTSNSIDPAFLDALPEDLRAEVLATRQTPTRAAPSSLPSSIEEIDPEFLAALPPDIQAEVLAQQQAQRLLQAQQAQRLLQAQQSEGNPADMDSASIIATFPAELREEVLLTSSAEMIATLPPALRAEAQLLQELDNFHHVRHLFGGLQRLGGGARNNAGLVSRGSSAAVGRGNASLTGRRHLSTVNGIASLKDAEGKPLVDSTALKALIRLLRLSQPLGKGLLQRLLLNLCVHSVTRASLIRLLLDMLHPDVEGFPTPGLAADGVAPLYRLYGSQYNVVYAHSQLSDGLPPLVSRRVLEILTYLARNHALVSHWLLYVEPKNVSALEGAVRALPSPYNKGKSKVTDGEMLSETDDEKVKGDVPIVLLLKLLNRPLYLRSSAHLEQVMGLLEVITSNAMKFSNSQTPPAVSSSEDVQANSQHMQTADASGSASLNEGRSTVDDSRVSKPISEEGVDLPTILLSLPKQELCNLCSLLVHQGLSDLAYTRIAEVLKKLADAVPSHRALFVSELANACRQLSQSAINELQNLAGLDRPSLNRASVVGGAFLRVVVALCTLVSSEGITEKNDEKALEKEQEDTVSFMGDLNAALEPIWQELSGCLGKIEGKLLTVPTNRSIVNVGVAGVGVVSAPLPPGTHQVLPFIEAFFVLCDKLLCKLSESASEIAEGANPLPLSDPSSLLRSSSFQKKSNEKGLTFARFSDRHKKLLNAFVRQNPGLLEKSLSLLLKTPRLVDFDNKRAYFRSKIRQQQEQQHYPPLGISVRRAYVLEDSYNQLRMRTPDELKGRLTVQFQGEEGVDAGGLTREWYQLLSRVIFDKGALLFTTVGNESTFQPNPNSVYQTEHLSYFKFVGRVVGKALFDGQLLDVYFTRSFYKHILGVKVTYYDIEAVDPDFYKNLKWLLENDVREILGLTFSIDADEEKHILYEKAEVTDHELIPGGRNIRVTEENKREYVDLVAEHKLTTAIRPQINAFLDGFNELFPRELISIFNDKELELLISGLPEIDLDDLKLNTEYSGYTRASPVVQWFWEVARSFSKEDMARLLQFVTGTSKVPLEGFRALQGISGPQRFQIHKAYGAPERLPSAHTCFNQLDLPEYASKEQLQERLMLAIHEASEGFGFG